MPGSLAILCYHRVLSDEPQTPSVRAYFVRGTAVREQTFAAHVRSLKQHMEVVGDVDVLAWLAGEREFSGEAAWITFDDGYRDVIERAAPILAAYGLPATAFVTTAVVESPGTWLPADLWYATLTRATRKRGRLRAADGSTEAFDLEHDYNRFVDGPERRRYLRAPPAEQILLRGYLAEALGAVDPPPADIYLTARALEQLVDAGWSIGGHGRTHALLPQLDAIDLAAETSRAANLYAKLGIPLRTFAYPDGAWTDEAVSAVQKAGWLAAVTLGNRAVVSRTAPFLLPRFLPSDRPDWVDEVLVPALRQQRHTDAQPGSV